MPRFTTPGESSHPGILARTPEWSLDERVRCSLRCGDFGDPGCWEIGNYEPCADCRDYEIPAQGGGGPEVDDGQTEALVATQAPRAKPQRQRHEPQGVTAGEYGTFSRIAQGQQS